MFQGMFFSNRSELLNYKVKNSFKKLKYFIIALYPLLTIYEIAGLPVGIYAFGVSPLNQKTPSRWQM